MKSNERNFIMRLQARKEDALEYRVDQYLPLVKGITLKVLSPLENGGMAEECINDVFLSVWNNSKKFEGDSAADFKKWICAIAKYKAIDYYRKAVKKMEHSAELLDAKTGNSAEDELLLLEDRAELMRLINLLDPVDRNIFIMKFFLGLKTEEIALKLGLTNSSVDNRLYRGKKRLQKKALNLNIRGSIV
ncbi:sigma-70 family RNA polymerase sigma factor [Bacillus infantis]|uniref:sigma-70 family RNA polymerase sigma factor n=1 Tax=Bacillus infantis TaxID=324767 RepID=UPI003CE7D597